MAQRRLPPLTDEQKSSIAQKARRSEEAAIVKRMADEALAIDPNNHWRDISPIHLEYVKVRVVGGETASEACRAIGLEPGHLNQYVYRNPAFRDELNSLRKAGNWKRLDDLWELPFRTDMSDNDKKLYLRVAQMFARALEPELFGEKVQVDVVEHRPVILDWNVIEGKGGDGV